tara:strand:+ start:120 stop:2285 length:2166 start_codon:yes stop_codon:yes gene_type:complete
MKKIKIICTIGPSSLDEKIVKKMDDSGVDYFRINLSHTKIDDLIPIFKNLRSWTNKPICLDTEGAQLRTSLLCNEIIAKEHEIIEFVPKGNLIKKSQIGINGGNINEVFKNGDLVTIDFDGAVVQITKNENSSFYSRVLHSGVIGNNKGLNVDRSVKLNRFTPKDEKAFLICQKIGIDHIFLSFCSHKSDVLELRNRFKNKIHVISKIESKNGLIHLDGICRESDALLIDRGDLSREVPLEKIPIAQNQILERSRKSRVPVYVATNLMENMILNSKPTRAEVNDIQSTLNNGAEGLVLAAETAIGKYPIECVRMMSRIIYETDNYKNNSKEINNLFTPSFGKIIEPHGGKLVQQFANDQIDHPICEIEVNEEIYNDSMQIANGTFSPVNGFMDQEQIELVLNKNTFEDKASWTIPIIFQINENKIKSIPNSGSVYLKKASENYPYAILNIKKVEKLENKNKLAKLWFETEDIRHPGVSRFLSSGDYIISGEPYILNNYSRNTNNKYELTPLQSRFVFDHNGWHNIVGFHTRNVPHSGHEFIQLASLKKINADAIFISPVTGEKKIGDFLADPIIQCYDLLIKELVYHPYGAIIGSFNTHSRFSGPREAIFTALCRQNFGCNYFIVGRDHTGVGNYYDPNASIRLFETLDLDIKIIPFYPVVYKSGHGLVEETSKNKEEILQKISGSIIRNYLINKKPIPKYMMRPSISNLLRKMKPEFLFQ